MYQPNDDFFQPNVNLWNLPERRLGVIVSIVEQDYMVGKYQGYDRFQGSLDYYKQGFSHTGFRRDSDFPSFSRRIPSRQVSNDSATSASTLDSAFSPSNFKSASNHPASLQHSACNSDNSTFDLATFYQESPKGFFIAEIDIYSCTLSERNTPIPRFNYTGTRYYSRYVPYRFHNNENYRHKAIDTLELIKHYYKDKVDLGKEKYDCIDSFVPFVGQIVSFVKKPTPKESHQSDEGHLVKFVCCDDKNKLFWNFPMSIPDILIHRVRNDKEETNDQKPFIDVQKYSQNPVLGHYQRNHDSPRIPNRYKSRFFK